MGIFTPEDSGYSSWLYELSFDWSGPTDFSSYSAYRQEGWG